MGTQQLKMKLIATFAALASANQYFGEREDGVQWSATTTNTALAYQEDGQSIVAMEMNGGEHTDAGIVCIPSATIAPHPANQNVRQSLSDTPNGTGMALR